jgi:hypothetical protein
VEQFELRRHFSVNLLKVIYLTVKNIKLLGVAKEIIKHFYQVKNVFLFSAVFLEIIVNYQLFELKFQKCPNRFHGCALFND